MQAACFFQDSITAEALAFEVAKRTFLKRVDAQDCPHRARRECAWPQERVLLGQMSWKRMLRDKIPPEIAKV
jgi:hypothetical protein